MIKMIVARSLNGVIGSQGGIPWHLSNDMRFFREITQGNTVVMGRKTFESIGKPLPNRLNVVVTRDTHFSPVGVTVVHSPEAVMQLPTQGDLFIIGGQQLYEAFLPQASEVFVTEVQADIAGDTYFPDLGQEWGRVKLQEHGADDRNDYSHIIYAYRRLPLV